MINFNALPSNKPTNLPPTGRYYATIEGAEMRASYDGTKPPYLNITLALKDAKGTAYGKIYDILSESDKPLVQYKIARFIIALHLENIGQFELADLTKVIKGKRLIVDVKQEEAKDGFPARASVDVFKGSIYYPIEDAKELFEESTQEATAFVDLADIKTDNDIIKIQAEDAADASAPFAQDDEF